MEDFLENQEQEMHTNDSASDEDVSMDDGENSQELTKEANDSEETEATETSREDLAEEGSEASKSTLNDPKPKLNPAEILAIKLKEQEKIAKGYEETLLPLAIGQGFTDVPSFLQAIKNQQLEQDAKKHNVPVEILRKQRELEETVQALQVEKAQEQFQLKFTNLKNEIDTFAIENGFTADDVLVELEKAGFDSIETLLTIPSLKTVIKGAMSDKLIEKRAGTLVKKQGKLNALGEVKDYGSPAPTKTDAELGREFARKLLGV